VTTTTTDMQRYCRDTLTTIHAILWGKCQLWYK